MAQIQAPAELEAFVQRLIVSGSYASYEEVVEDALRLLKDQTEHDEARLDQLRKQIAVGLEQAERGESVPFDMNALRAEAQTR